MASLLETLGELIGSNRKYREVARRHSRTFVCRCGTHIFFRNSLCLHCQATLGYIPGEGRMVAIDPGPQSGTWVAEGVRSPQKCCGNRDTPARCNWMLAADDPNPRCIACRLNRTIPNLDDADNARYWGLIELAKRRLVSELLALGLPVKSKVDEDPQRGLMFDFLRSPAEGPPVMTGHAGGLITLNVEEADDSAREKIRFEMHEPYRTLLGHLRHEVGHYYWDRLIADTSWLERFRDLFENSPDAIFVEDMDGTVLDANFTACVLHGMTRDQLIGKNADASEITASARRNGMRNLREDGWLKVAAGVTTAAEVVRVTQEF